MSKDHVTVLEASGRVYRMITDDEQVLVADPKGRSGGELEISCGGRTYEAQVSLFRNLAVASNPDGERAVQLSGGLMGRNYRGLFDAEDACAHSVAIFLLWHVVANRRRAYRTGGGMM